MDEEDEAGGPEGAHDEEELLHQNAEAEAGRTAGGAGADVGKGKEARVRELGDGRGKVNAAMFKK